MDDLDEEIKTMPSNYNIKLDRVIDVPESRPKTENDLEK